MGILFNNTGRKYIRSTKCPKTFVHDCISNENVVLYFNMVIASLVENFTKYKRNKRQIWMNLLLRSNGSVPNSLLVQYVVLSH